jgi:hypothetical protein
VILKQAGRDVASISSTEIRNQAQNRISFSLGKWGAHAGAPLIFFSVARREFVLMIFETPPRVSRYKECE